LEIDNVNLSKLSSGERISSISAILLFVFMFFHWFEVKAVNTSNLLFAIKAGGPGKSAWEALEYIPIFLVLTVGITFVAAATRLVNKNRKPSVSLNAVVALFGIASALLVLFRIIDPPVFHIEPTITMEGAPQLPMFLALAAAVGIAFGGYWAMREEGVNLLGTGAPARRGRTENGPTGES
jgi:low temperature requirement protein LtrA